MLERVPATADDLAAPPGSGISPGRLVLRRFLRHRLAVGSAVLLVLMALASLAAPLVADFLGQDVETVNLFERFAPAKYKKPAGHR